MSRRNLSSNGTNASLQGRRFPAALSFARSRYNPGAMPTVTLPFGDSAIQAELPERTRFVGGSGGGPRLEPVADQAATVRAALESPLGMPRVRKLVPSDGRVLISFDDPTAPSFGPISSLAIEAVRCELQAAVVP